jgi:23S rRNA (adenine2503-C2)-methyltransferase
MDLLGQSPKALRAWAVSVGLPAFRGDQVFDAAWRGAARFSEVPGLGRALAERLDALGPLSPVREVGRQESADGTVKSLLALHDGRRVECVSIPGDGRHTVCVSTQVGCAVGCTFCASGLDGVERDLAAGEIAAQVLHHHPRGPVSNIVFMGAGEPLFNYDALLGAIRALAHPRALGLGRRRFTVSTSGVPRRIVQLGRDEPQVTLAFSLHAPDDETRSRIVPLNRRWPLADVFAAIREYQALVNRRPTFEYVLLADLNMEPRHADGLAQHARAHHAHINLIPYNPVHETPHRAPTAAEVRAFADRVAAAGGHVTVRTPRGQDIDAACGQLKRKSAG